MEERHLFSSSFGELLKTFRRRRRLTQKHLAQQLGVHMNTISSWELGMYLPAARGLVLELARCLLLDEQETRQLLEASLTALSPHWHIPFARNPFFTGREEVLKALHTCLHTKQMVALTHSCALNGLGGIGKTQVALEYAHRHALEYSAIFWIEAETIEYIVSSLLCIAEVLALPERQEADQQRVVASVQHWLTTHTQWLLIWDNLEDLELLHRFLPPIRQGAVLITTRCQALGALTQGVDLEPLEPEDGILLLLRRTKLLSPEATHEDVQQFAAKLPGEYTAAAELVRFTGALPLALDQAGAYIEETGCSLASYLRLYEQQCSRLLNRRGGAGKDHPQSVAATFLLLMERVTREHRVAADILRVCALLHAEAIPEEVFVEGAAHLESAFELGAADPSQFDQALATLRRFSLVRRHPTTQTLSFHRLVQVVLRESMSEHERALWQQRVIHALNALFPEMTVESTPAVWRQCERLLPHVLVVTASLTDQAGGARLAQLLWKAAEYLRERAQYERVEPLYRRALRVGEQALGTQHPALAYPLTGLAYLYLEQGRFEQAEPLFQRSFQIREQALGPDHPLLAFPLLGLAILARKRWRLEQAECFFTRALQIREQALGPDHPLVSLVLDGLAILSEKQGKLEQARLLYERALSIQRQTLGPEHPQLTRLLFGLADLYQQQGKYEQAEPLFQEALSIGEQAWGPDHPEVAYPLQGLAELYLEQGEDEQAESLSLRVLHLWEQAWGPEHLLVSYPLHSLAILAHRQGKDEQAEQLSRRALSIVEQALVPEHPQVIASLQALARLYVELSKREQAELLYQRILSIQQPATRSPAN